MALHVWRRYRQVDCPACGVVWAHAPARLLGGIWWIVCPNCGEQRWRAVRAKERHG
jgi:predicted RNA-binding Zn-ribbon protein involved in translation (DUF1610 family)